MDEDLIGAAAGRVLARLTILELPEEDDTELVDELVRLLTFESGNNPPAIIAGGALVWRGYVTGGLGTLYEQVGPLADRYGLSALIADERLEVHVTGGAEKVLVLGPLTDTMEVSRWLWEHRVERAMDPDELAQWFVFDRIQDSSELLLAAAAGEDDDVTPSPSGARPPRIDYARVAGSVCTVLESYEPDGSLQDAVVECRPVAGRWRTDFQAPYVDRDGGRTTIVGWRVAQWELVARPDDWALAARAGADLATVLTHLPLALRPWAIARTQAALELIDAIAPGRDRTGRRDRLRRELEQAIAG
jgi:hypothetical protein